jgi:hypothetical protein
MALPRCSSPDIRARSKYENTGYPHRRALGRRPSRAPLRACRSKAIGCLSEASESSRSSRTFAHHPIGGCRLRTQARCMSEVALPTRRRSASAIRRAAGRQPAGLRSRRRLEKSSLRETFRDSPCGHARSPRSSPRRTKSTRSHHGRSRAGQGGQGVVAGEIALRRIRYAERLRGERKAVRRDFGGRREIRPTRRREHRGVPTPVVILTRIRKVYRRGRKRKSGAGK